MLVFIITIILLSIQFLTFPNTKEKTKTETWYDKNLLKKFSKWNFTFKGNWEYFPFPPFCLSYDFFQILLIRERNTRENVFHSDLSRRSFHVLHLGSEAKVNLYYGTK